MSATETVAAAQTAGVQLGLDGTGLLIKHDSEPPLHLLDALRRDKPEILALLRTRGTGDVSPPETAILTSETALWGTPKPLRACGIPTAAAASVGCL